jgi:hypothetical protein
MFVLLAEVSFQLVERPLRAKLGGRRRVTPGVSTGTPTPA